MRKLAAAIVALALVAGGAWAAESPTPTNVIHATGQATVKVVPDTVRVQCSLRAQGKDAPTVAQDAQGDLQAVREALAALKLPGLTVTDTGLTVSVRQQSPYEDMPLPGGDAGAGGAPPDKSPGFFAATTLAAVWQGEEAALHANAAKITAAVVGASGNALVLVTPLYLKEDESAERSQAWEQAVKSAVANAQTLARGLGVTISGFTSASMTAGEIPWEGLAQGENPMAQYMSRLANMFPGGENQIPDLPAPEVTVTAYVDAAYK